MQVEKLRKTCGYILYIKSIIALVVTIILIFGGITMAIMGKHMVDNPGQGDNTEIVSVIVGIFITVAGIANIKEAVGIILLVVAVILIAQSIATIVLLSKLKKLNSVN